MSPISEKLELAHHLYLLRQARLENNDAKRHLEVKRNTAAGSFDLQHLEELGQE